MRDRSTVAWVILGVFVITGGTIPVFATPSFGYTSPINPPPVGEANHAQILGSIYGQNFTANGLDYEGDGGITAFRVYDFDDIDYFTTHVYNREPNDVDQIWTDGAVTVTATAKYACWQQAFGWNGGGEEGTNFIKLVDDENMNTPVSFTIEAGEEFLWGHQAKSCSWWPSEKKEWWSRESENAWWGEEDHMVTYFLDGVSLTETVWMIFIEDEKLCNSDRDYNDFVIEIRAIPEPASILLLGLGALALLRKRKA